MKTKRQFSELLNCIYIINNFIYDIYYKSIEKV